MDGLTVSMECSALRGCVEACDQCEALVAGLSDTQYGASVGEFSSIGAHMRHCVEHFQCFFEGIASGVADYDGRRRDRAIETQLASFSLAMKGIRASLAALEGSDLRRPLKVRQSAARGAASECYESTVARELVFLSGHCIHHIALMKTIAALQGLQIGPTLGVAYSTENWQASGAAVAGT